MKKFYIFAMLAYGFLAIHILEESLRLGLENAETSVLIPFIFFPLGFIGLYLKKRWGFWMVWLMSILTAILPTLSHIVPSSSSFVGIIFSFWGGLTGFASVLVSILLSVAAIAGVITGGKIIKNLKVELTQQT